MTSLLLLAIWLGLMPSVLRCQAYMDFRDEVLGMAVVASGGWGGVPRLMPLPVVQYYRAKDTAVSN